MHATPNPQLGLLDGLMPSAPANDFLQRLDAALDWKPMEKALQAMYPATTGRPPCPPLVLFKMSLLQHCYGLSDPQCEELVPDRWSWRRFVGLGLQDKVSDETTPVRFRQRLLEHGQEEKLLLLISRQLEEKGFILKTCTLVDATLLQAARRAPAKEDKTGGDGQAGYTVKQGQPRYGYKARVAVDQTHTLIRQATLTAPTCMTAKNLTPRCKAMKRWWRPTKPIGVRRAVNGVANMASRKGFCASPVEEKNLLRPICACTPCSVPFAAASRKSLAGGNAARANGGCAKWGGSPTGWNWSSNASVGT